MKRVWPIIAVSDVRVSAQWYMELLGARQTHPGGTTFDQVVDEDGTVLLCVHYWGPTGTSGTHEWRDPGGYHVAINEAWGVGV
jgi:hypothetical protein